jgi:hypothetical protein
MVPLGSYIGLESGQVVPNGRFLSIGALDCKRHIGNREYVWPGHIERVEHTPSAQLDGLFGQTRNHKAHGEQR